MKSVWLFCGILETIGSCEAKPKLQRVILTLRYEMKQSLSSAPSSSKPIKTANRFTLTVSDSFYAMIDPARGGSFQPIVARTRKWKGEFWVTGHTESTDGDQHLKCDVTGGRALTQGEMPTFAFSPAPMGAGQSLACQFDFPVKLKIQTVLTTPQGSANSVEAAPGSVPACLESSASATVFRQSIEANPPLTRRPQDEAGAQTYDGFKGLQRRGEFWLSSPTFFELKRAAPDLYTCDQTRAFPFKPSKTETQSWTQSLSLKLAILPA